MAITAAHQMIGLPNEVIAEAQVPEAVSPKQPDALSSQKNEVGRSIRGQVSGLDAYGCEACKFTWKEYISRWKCQSDWSEVGIQAKKPVMALPGSSAQDLSQPPLVKNHPDQLIR